MFVPAREHIAVEMFVLLALSKPNFAGWLSALSPRGE
jgi:hypothetical protein